MNLYARNEQSAVVGVSPNSCSCVLKGIKKVVQVPIAQTTLMGNNSGLLVIVSGSSGSVLLVPKQLVVGGWWVVVVARV